MTQVEPQSDGELAGRAQTGDRKAFDLLVQRHKGPLFRLIRRHVGSDDDSYDVLQDTFVSAWMALSRYDTRRPFAVWIISIALNKCRDYGRRLSVRRRFMRFFALGQSDFESAADAMLVGERDDVESVRLDRLDKAIAELAAFYKEPLLLTTVSGLSQQQAAEQLRTTTKAIEMRIRRARKTLAKALVRPDSSSDNYSRAGVTFRKK